MATKVTRIIVCDVCEGDSGIVRWKLTDSAGGRSLTTDLCADHSKPFDELFKKLRPNGKPRRATHQVLSEKQIKERRSRRQ